MVGRILKWPLPISHSHPRTLNMKRYPAYDYAASQPKGDLGLIQWHEPFLIKQTFLQLVARGQVGKILCMKRIQGYECQLERKKEGHSQDQSVASQIRE